MREKFMKLIVAQHTEIERQIQQISKGKIYSLRKLPSWGAEKDRDKFDFEWPTMEDLGLLDRDIRISKISFKGGNVIS